jgi:hypothetical protein
VSEKPRYVLLATATAGVCHWCLQVPRYTVLARDHIHERDVILRACRPHLVFLQSSNRAPVELLAIDGYASPDLDLSRPGEYVSRRPFAPDIQPARTLTGL